MNFENFEPNEICLVYLHDVVVSDPVPIADDRRDLLYVPAQRHAVQHCLAPVPLGTFLKIWEVFVFLILEFFLKIFRNLGKLLQIHFWKIYY